jgi:excisionase family DNA binding protein
MVTENKLVYTVNEASEKLHVCAHTMRKLIKEGKVPVVVFSERKRMIPIAALEKYLANVTAGTANVT